jgi:hypothetical protein
MEQENQGAIMPLKNKNEYRAYMAGYMGKKRRKSDAINYVTAKHEAEEIEHDIVSGKPVIDISKVGSLVSETKEMLNTGRPTDADDDPVLKMVDKYGKYLPLVMDFLKGLQGSLAAAQPAAQQLQPPPGWANMTPMQRLGYKHTRVEWYNAGEAYELALESGGVNPRVNISYVDPSYRQPQDLQQLARKYPEPPLVKENPPFPTPAKRDEPKQDSAAQIVAELQADNLRYIQLGADFVNKLSNEDFSKNLEDSKILSDKIKPFLPLLPVHVKAMIMQTKKEDLEALFKERCPAKYEFIAKEKKTQQLLELFEGLRGMVQ